MKLKEISLNIFAKDFNKRIDMRKEYPKNVTIGSKMFYLSISGNIAKMNKKDNAVPPLYFYFRRQSNKLWDNKGNLVGTGKVLRDIFR